MNKNLKIGPEFIWKNFHLGTELEIAGSFIFDSVYCFDRMDNFYHESKIFDFLYHLSVGIERLQKILLVLLEQFDNRRNAKFERDLITHSSQDLQQRISQLSKVNFGKPENKLLTLLTNFYNNNRYGRFSFVSSNDAYHERKDFIEYLHYVTSMEITAEAMNCTPNDNLIKITMGKCINKIVSSYYNCIKKICESQNIYTYEMDYDSKAFQIFECKRFNLISYNHIKNEVLFFLMKNSADILQDVTLTPVDFDPDAKNELYSFLLNICKSTYLTDSYECIIGDDVEIEEAQGLIEERNVALDYYFDQG